MSEKLCKGYYVVLRELTLSPRGTFLTAYDEYFATLDAAQAFTNKMVINSPSGGTRYIAKVEVVAHPEVTVTVRNE